MINKSKKLTGPFLIDLKNKFREIAGDDQLIDREEFRNGLQLSNKEIANRLFDIFDRSFKLYLISLIMRWYEI